MFANFIGEAMMNTDEYKEMAEKDENFESKKIVSKIKSIIVAPETTDDQDLPEDGFKHVASMVRKLKVLVAQLARRSRDNTSQVSSLQKRDQFDGEREGGNKRLIKFVGITVGLAGYTVGLGMLINAAGAVFSVTLSSFLIGTAIFAVGGLTLFFGFWALVAKLGQNNMNF